MKLTKKKGLNQYKLVWEGLTAGKILCLLHSLEQRQDSKIVQELKQEFEQVKQLLENPWS